MKRPALLLVAAIFGVVASEAFTWTRWAGEACLIVSTVASIAFIATNWRHVKEVLK